MIFFLLKNQGLTINGAIKAINENSKKLDDTKTTSIKADYYKKIIKPTEEELKLHKEYLKSSLKKNFFNQIFVYITQ